MLHSLHAHIRIHTRAHTAFTRQEQQEVRSPSEPRQSAPSLAQPEEAHEEGALEGLPAKLCRPSSRRGGVPYGNTVFLSIITGHTQKPFVILRGLLTHCGHWAFPTTCKTVVTSAQGQEQGTGTVPFPRGPHSAPQDGVLGGVLAARPPHKAGWTGGTKSTSSNTHTCAHTCTHAYTRAHTLTQTLQFWGL